MAAEHRTAYPRFAESYSARALERDFTVTDDEKAWLKLAGRSAEARLGLCWILKSTQLLHRVPALSEIPESVREHLRNALGLGKQITPDYTTDGVWRRHRNAVVTRLGLTSYYGSEASSVLEKHALAAAEIVNGKTEIIDAAIDALVLAGIELPEFSTLDTAAEAAHASVQRRIVGEIYARTPENLRLSLLGLLASGYSGHLTRFNDLKQSAQKVSREHLYRMSDHLQWLDSFGDFSAVLKGIKDSKIRFFADLAKQYDAGSLKDFVEAKRVVCILSLIHRMRVRTRDQITEMLLKRISTIHKRAQQELEAMHLRQRGTVQRIAATLGGVVSILSMESDDETAGKKIRDYVGSNEKAKALLEECNDVEAKSSTNHLSLLWEHFSGARAVLFRIVGMLEFEATSDDRSVLDALAIVQANQNKKRDWLREDVDIGFLSRQWRQLVQHKTGTGVGIHRQSFEVAVFSYLADQIRSGDIAVVGSEDFADYRAQLLSWDECEKLLPEYCKKTGLPQTKDGFVNDLRSKLEQAAKQLDQRYPSAGDDLVINSKGVPVVKRVTKREIPESALQLEAEIAKRMPTRNLIDVLTNIQHWTDFTRHFGPISKNETKLSNPTEKYLMAVFANGTNLGPTQAARHFAKQQASAATLSYVNKRHVTKEGLEAGIEDFAAHYERLALPKVWGDGGTVSADGTQYDFYEDNILTGYHFRYKRMGAVAYRLVANNYFAVFQHLIGPGVWEAIYVIEGLMKAHTGLEPDTVHSDTQGQSAAVFCFTYLAGITLMPRIRNWTDLLLCRPSRDTKYEHIDSLFRGNVDWALIENHWKDVMQVALSIETGKISSPALLRKLGSHSLKNKLYFVAQEIGNVVRTTYLLKWLGSRELRQEVTAGTNKSEAYNFFGKYFGFGGDKIPTNDPDEQQKRLRYNDLLAMAIILHNVVDMTRILEQLKEEGYPVNERDEDFLSPYTSAHIKRFGDYHIDVSRQMEDWIKEATFESVARDVQKLRLTPAVANATAVGAASP